MGQYIHIQLDKGKNEQESDMQVFFTFDGNLYIKIAQKQKQRTGLFCYSTR